VVHWSSGGLGGGLGGRCWPLGPTGVLPGVDFDRLIAGVGRRVMGGGGGSQEASCDFEGKKPCQGGRALVMPVPRCILV
jgi:hypothetical protein